MKKVKIILIVIVSTIFLTTCRKDFPRQMAIEIKSETHTSNSVTFSLNLPDLGGNSIVQFGIIYSTTNSPPIDGNDSKVFRGTSIAGVFVFEVANLSPGKTYFFRAFIKADEVIKYSETITIATLPGIAGTVTDIDGNVYNTITIGTQVWMAENLKTTKYRNGNAIPNVTDNATWAALTTGAYCNYNNDANNVAIYGRLYNWYALSDSRNIAPIGWHVSTDAEWTTLTSYLGGETGAGGKLKETGTSHWASPNTGATNQTGFTALPGGARFYNGPFDFFEYTGCWWTSTEGSTSSAWGISMYYNDGNKPRTNFPKYYGFSVRCVKD
jgi:uncharacterized protein (TIGR02145 family)